MIAPEVLILVGGPVDEQRRAELEDLFRQALGDDGAARVCFVAEIPANDDADRTERDRQAIDLERRERLASEGGRRRRGPGRRRRR